jgi:hypothetical protein
MKQIPIILLFLISLVSAATAQSQRDRAEGALDSAIPIENIFNRSLMENTVKTFETDTPEESNLTAEEFDEEELLRQSENTPTANAFSNQKDSALGRPNIDIEDGALDLANNAIEQSDAIAGGLFSSNGGQCDSLFEGGSEFQGLQWCRKILSQDYKTCVQSREISVDRSDTWQCNVETADYLKTCNKSASYTCNGLTGNSCIQNAVNISGKSASWSGRVANVAIPKRGSNSCSIKTDTFYVSYKNSLNLSSLRLSSFTFRGVAQIKINGTVAYAYGGHRGNLSAGSRGCGKNCTQRVINASQSGFVSLCNASSRSASPNINLKPYVNVARPGTTTETSTSITLPANKTSNRVRIDIIRGNTTDRASTTKISVSGSCCSSFNIGVTGSC